MDSPKKKKKMNDPVGHQNLRFCLDDINEQYQELSDSITKSLPAGISETDKGRLHLYRNFYVFSTATAYGIELLRDEMISVTYQNIKSTKNFQDFLKYFAVLEFKFVEEFKSISKSLETGPLTVIGAKRVATVNKRKLESMLSIEEKKENEIVETVAQLSLNEKNATKDNNFVLHLQRKGFVIILKTIMRCLVNNFHKLNELEDGTRAVVLERCDDVIRSTYNLSTESNMHRLEMFLNAKKKDGRSFVSIVKYLDVSLKTELHSLEVSFELAMEKHKVDESEKDLKFVVDNDLEYTKKMESICMEDEKMREKLQQLYDQTASGNEQIKIDEEKKFQDDKTSLYDGLSSKYYGISSLASLEFNMEKLSMQNEHVRVLKEFETAAARVLKSIEDFEKDAKAAEVLFLQTQKEEQKKLEDEFIATNARITAVSEIELQALIAEKENAVLVLKKELEIERLAALKAKREQLTLKINLLKSEHESAIAIAQDELECLETDYHIKKNSADSTKHEETEAEERMKDRKSGINEKENDFKTKLTELNNELENDDETAAILSQELNGINEKFQRLEQEELTTIERLKLELQISIDFEKKQHEEKVEALKKGFDSQSPSVIDVSSIAAPFLEELEHIVQYKTSEVSSDYSKWYVFVYFLCTFLSIHFPQVYRVITYLLVHWIWFLFGFVFQGHQ
jgi:hypothetical protein